MCGALLLYQCLALQDDWAGWIEFTSGVEGKVQTVGDDLTVTNIKRIKKAADEGACNALLLKVRWICLSRAPKKEPCMPWSDRFSQCGPRWPRIPVGPRRARMPILEGKLGTAVS